MSPDKSLDTAERATGALPAEERTGFALALTHAITTSGHSLERVRSQLADRGHHVSMATLSYWRTGQRKPGRASSLAAVAELERILDCPTGALVQHVIPGPQQQFGLGDFFRIAGTDTRYEKALARLDLSYDDGLDRRSIQDLIDLDAAGRQVRSRTRMIVSAIRDDVRRFPIIFSVDEGSALTLRPLAGFTLGRRLHTPDGKVALSEAVLERPLARGDLALLEFECLAGENAPLTSRFLRGHPRSTPLQVLTVNFHPRRMPTSFERYEQNLAQARPTVTPMLVTASTMTLVYEEVGPGVAGCRWQW